MVKELHSFVFVPTVHTPSQQLFTFTDMSGAHTQKSTHTCWKPRLLSLVTRHQLLIWIIAYLLLMHHLRLKCSK